MSMSETNSDVMLKGGSVSDSFLIFSVKSSSEWGFVCGMGEGISDSQKDSYSVVIRPLAGARLRRDTFSLPLDILTQAFYGLQLISSASPANGSNLEDRSIRSSSTKPWTVIRSLYGSSSCLSLGKIEDSLMRCTLDSCAIQAFYLTYPLEIAKGNVATSHTLSLLVPT